MPRAKIVASRGSSKVSKRSALSHKKRADRRQREAKRKREQSRAPVPDHELERKSPLHHRVVALINARYPDKRTSGNAYDDRVCKKYKPATAFSMPWEHERNDPGLEKPSYIPEHLFSTEFLGKARTFTSSVDEEPHEEDLTMAMGAFSKLSAEVRDDIFRFLLVSHRNIRVLREWSLIYPRHRPGLYPSLLRVCQVFYRQGIRILYGENTFLYLNRDPWNARADTGTVLKKIYENCNIPIDKHGHLIRNITVVAEANRTHLVHNRDNLSEALQKFIPGGDLIAPAQLRMVTLKIPAMNRRELNMEMLNATDDEDVPYADYLRVDTSLFRALDLLDCQFIRIVAYDRSGSQYETTIDRRPHFTQLDANAGHKDIWARDVIMLKARKEHAQSSRARLNTIWFWLERLVKRDFNHAQVREIFKRVSQAEGGSEDGLPGRLFRVDEDWFVREDDLDWDPPVIADESDAEPDDEEYQAG
jgi:hypothetical protein